MKLIPVALAIFYRQTDCLEVWTQRRTDDGIYHGLMEFPGGKIEAHELPLEACVREIEEEVGIRVDPAKARFMGIYPNHLENRTILLNVFLFPETTNLEGKGEWMRIEVGTLSSHLRGIIPGPNHEIIDDLYRSLYSERLGDKK
jgi:8-oxo-dGTP diphosphatase